MDKAAVDGLVLVSETGETVLIQDTLGHVSVLTVAVISVTGEVVQLTCRVLGVGADVGVTGGGNAGAGLDRVL